MSQHHHHHHQNHQTHHTGHCPQHSASGHYPHSSSRNVPQYSPAPVAAPAAAPDPTRPTPTRPTPGAHASSSGVILHQPYPNSVGTPPIQAQYAQHQLGPRPTASASSSISPPPPIPTHTRPIDMPASPARPGSTNYGVSPHPPEGSSVDHHHQCECSRTRSRSRSTRCSSGR